MRISCFHTNLSGFYSNFPHPTFTLNPETTPISLCRAVKPQILGYLAVKVAMTTMVQIIATLYDLAFRATLVDILNHPLFWYVLENLRESMSVYA